MNASARREHMDLVWSLVKLSLEWYRSKTNRDGVLKQAVKTTDLIEACAKLEEFETAHLRERV